MRYNTKLEKAIFKLIGVKVKPCGHYDRFEQCCNDSTYLEDERGSFCEVCCPNGTGGEAFLPFTKFCVNLERLFNWTKFRMKGYNTGKFKWL